MTTLSGGQAARASLAAILLAQFDVFLLDEPTNDLDFAGLERLEHFLDGLSGGAIVVSHDRAFLDRTITSVLELDERSHRRRASRAAGRRIWKNAPPRASTRRPPTRRTSTSGVPSSNAPASNDSGPFRERATSRSGPRTTTRRSATSSSTAPRSKRPRCGSPRRRSTGSRWSTSRGKDGTFVWRSRLRPAQERSWRDSTTRSIRRGDFTLGPIDLEIGWAERVAVLGPNGAGKTTLLEALAGTDPARIGNAMARARCHRRRDRPGAGAAVGRRVHARRVHAGEWSRPSPTSALVAREVRTWLPTTSVARRRRCRRVNALGPCSRLLMARGVNCLVLDEPTNHLDLPAIEQLEQALDTFDGHGHPRHARPPVARLRPHRSTDRGRYARSSVSDAHFAG